MPKSTYNKTVKWIKTNKTKTERFEPSHQVQKIVQETLHHNSSAPLCALASCYVTNFNKVM